MNLILGSENWYTRHNVKIIHENRRILHSKHSYHEKTIKYFILKIYGKKCSNNKWNIQKIT